jgi:hypothetical protein
MREDRARRVERDFVNGGDNNHRRELTLPSPLIRCLQRNLGLFSLLHLAGNEDLHVFSSVDIQ